MKTKFFVLTLIMFVFGAILFAQETANINDPVLLTIEGEKVTKSEFLAVYNKNNSNKKSKINEEDLKEYLELYINFRLKVKEAENLKLDTAQSFVNELAGYRKQLVQPYLIDREVDEKLLEEAFERSQYDIRASHILVKVDAEASPKDTLLAWNKAIKIRNRIVAGEDFGKVAFETSEDPSARDRVQQGRPPVKGNRGDLGYFSVFDMIYPFETAAFNAKIGEVTMPVRSSFGYHIIKVSDRKPSLGKVQVAHLLINKHTEGNKDDSLKNIKKIEEIKSKIKEAVSFEELVKDYSDDKGSAAKGGMLPWFGPNRMVPEFVEAIYGLEKNQISEPVLTMYGWHFIKLLDKREVASFDESKGELKVRISRDNRSHKSKEAFVERLKKEYKFKEDTRAYNDVLKLVDTSALSGNWEIPAKAKLDKQIVSFANNIFTQNDFAKYIVENQNDANYDDVGTFVKARYNKWVEAIIIEYEDSILEDKHKDFKDLYREYRDGILLFELTDQKVWSKAVKDTAGLFEFYEDMKHLHMNPQKVEAYIYKFKDEKLAKKSLKLINKSLAKSVSTTEILSLLNKKNSIAELESGVFAKGESKFMDSFEWREGVSDIAFDAGSYKIVYIKKYYETAPKSFDEIKGLVISEYQNYLEKEWIKDLRSKYKYTLDKAVYNSILN